MRIRTRICGWLVVVFAACGALAAERAERSLSVERAVARGGSMNVENLLGSITIRGGEEHRAARIEARIVAEAKTEEEARALVESVTLREADVKGTFDVHVAFPVERYTAFKLPSSEQDNLVKRWVATALDRDSVGVEYDGRLVQLGRQKGAAALAVHLTVVLPMDVRSSFRQIVGAIDGATSRGDLHLDVVEGHIYADHLYGTLNARSGGGFVEVTSFTGDELAVQTASGNLALAEVTTRKARLTTGSGAIQIDGIQVEDLEVASSSGDVAMAGLAPGRMHVEAGTGDIDLAPSFSGTREASVHAGTGNVMLRVTEIASFSLAAQSPTGEVHATGLELELLSPSEGVKRYRRGIGGPELRITADEGAIMVRSRE